MAPHGSPARRICYSRPDHPRTPALAGAVPAAGPERPPRLPEPAAPAKGILPCSAVSSRARARSAFRRWRGRSPPCSSGISRPRTGATERAFGAARHRRAHRLALSLLLPRLHRLRALLDGVPPAPLVALVGGRLGADRLRHLVPGAARRDDQRMVPDLLRHHPEGAGGAGRRLGGRLLRPARHLPRHRHGVHHHRRAQPLLHQPFRVPLAHRDERPLCRLWGRCGISRAPRSACRKTPCASPESWSRSACASSTR